MVETSSPFNFKTDPKFNLGQYPTHIHCHHIFHSPHSSNKKLVVLTLTYPATPVYYAAWYNCHGCDPFPNVDFYSPSLT